MASFCMMLIFGCLHALSSAGGTITNSLWSTRSFTELVTLRYYRSLGQLSRIKCIGSCTKMFDCDQIYMEDKVCYCLAPGYVPLSDPMISGEVTLTIHNYIYQLYHDKSECVTRNYTLFTGTNYCLKLITTPLSWMDAEQHCKQDGGHLVSAENPEKLNNVISTNNNLGHIFLGGFRPAEATDNSVYRWINHERVNNSFWKPNEPNNFNFESVVELYLSGKLNNKNKDVKFIFMCEILVHGVFV